MCYMVNYSQYIHTFVSQKSFSKITFRLVCKGKVLIFVAPWGPLAGIEEFKKI